MKRFLLLWLILSPAYLLVAVASSWILLRRLDLTFAAVASWIVIPPAQALTLCLVRRDGGNAPARRPPRAALAVLAAGACLLLGGLAWPHGALGLAAPDGFQPVLRRVLALAAGLLFLASASRVRGCARYARVAFGALLAALGADAVVPWLAAAPSHVTPWGAVFVPSAVVFGGLLATGIALALAVRPARADAPWAARLLDAAVAAAFVAAHAAALNYVRRPWLAPPWDALVPAAAAASAILLAAAVLALHAEETP